MASVQRGSSRSLPPPDQLASFYKLLDQKVRAAVLCRRARNLDLTSQAALQAEALFGDDSLVVADLRYSESFCLHNLATQASDAEQKALLQRSWALLVSLVDLLLRRLADNTLLPGTIRQEEMDYEAYAQAAALRTKNEELVRSPAVLRAVASMLGYNTLLMVMSGCLNLLQHQSWPAAQLRSVQLFVLRSLDVIPRTAGIQFEANPAGECTMLARIEKMEMRYYEPTFYTAVLRKWRSDAVSSILRARGVLQTGTAQHEQAHAKFDALKRADIAKHGLRDCAVPSCSKTEKTVKEFSLCAGCRSHMYCCLEHQALDWKAHKKACKEKQAARLAEEATESEETGAAAVLV